MKKYGKKWRKVQKEKAIRRANTKVGEPFSKARKRKHLCCHYGGVPGGIVPGFCFSKLVEINDNECMCVECGKIFPIEKHKQMEELVSYLSNKGCITNFDYIDAMLEGLEPVYYRRISENEIEIIETGDKILPRHTCIRD